jgi:EmrB/QacA subfamily drug resistance transporter
MSSETLTQTSASRSQSGMQGRVMILILVCIAQFMLLIDDTIVNVALPSIAKDMQLSEGALSWINNAYLLMFGGFLLIGGRLADLVGRKRMFAIAMSAFVVASAICGLAPNSTVLIFARGVQGFAGALMSPAALSILLATFVADKERTRALATWTSLTALGAATGLLVGGALVQYMSWNWIFWINLPVGIVTLALAARTIPADARNTGAVAPGFTSAALGTSALLALVFSVVETSTYAWTSTRTLAGLGIALALGIAFVLRERSSDNPLIPAAVIRRPNIALGNVFMFGAAAALLAMFFFLTLYMQNVLGYSAMQTGLAYLPFSLTLGVFSGIVAKLIEKVSAIPFLTIGALVAAAGMAQMSMLDVSSGYVTALLPALMTVAAGFGIAFVPILGVATAGAPAKDSGIASGLVNSAQQIGGAIGIAVLVTIATTATGNASATGAARGQALVDGFQSAFVVQTTILLATALVGIAIAMFARDSGRLQGMPVPA